MNQFEKNILSLHGDKGKTWLAHLPKIIEEMTKRYALSQLTPVKCLSYNYVLSGFQGVRPIILKLAIDYSTLKREAATLNAFYGYGTPEIISECEGALLLERAIPGTSLTSYFPSHDKDAVRIACSIMNRLHQAPLPKFEFSHVKDWLSTLDNSWNLPENLLQKARRMRDHLLQSSSAPVLLHGDLHHDNILQHGSEFMVIDPKGVIGEPCYEVAAFIRNPIPLLLKSAESCKIIDRRVTDFSVMLELNPDRIRNWCFVQSVLAWVWALEDAIDTAYFKKLTEIFDEKLL